jgi:hypothetical protein
LNTAIAVKANPKKGTHQIWVITSPQVSAIPKAVSRGQKEGLGM